ncbi:FecR domain-containing protein [Geobacter sp. AOG2]|uniref:FecR family protein n=1 Tax=Geobacter sp. AOG2 TaxID=1566347 RepID=UPI001CC5DEAE|nr:FecR domain-containing protein [Geobacter sp. AOG2]
MRYFLVVFFAVSLVPVFNLPCMAAGPDHAGVVKSVVGDVAILRNGTPIKAAAHMKLLKGDQIRTGSNGKVGMIFEDDTVISVGPDSRVVIEDFLFQPSEKRLSFITRIIQGTVSYLSGQIAKLAPNLVRIETPQATVGLRGTHVLIKVD